MRPTNLERTLVACAVAYIVAHLVTIAVIIVVGFVRG